jgi:predicted GIY-YIG superfamily endonuclease
VDEAFKRYIESLHLPFQKLLATKPVKIGNLPKDLPSKCIYLFSEGEKYLYVGRTNNFRSRMRQHSIPAALHNQAVSAFKLAREMTGCLEASYKMEGSRAALARDSKFSACFLEMKARVRGMDLRFIEEVDPLRQTLLEIYVAVVLKTPYNDFDTH